jgi:hypothetical protein
MTIPRASLVSAALVLVSCSPRGPVQHYDALGPEAEPLRTAFNADTGHVRAIALASPT